MAEEDTTDKIDLSGKGLKKLEKSVGIQSQATVLILDDNELQRLDNVGLYTSLQRLSAVRNQLVRMYGVSKLQNLTSLNLAHNNLVGIEGLKELLNLRWLCLAGNNVKAIDHLNTNINLEHLDLSENNIGCISDLSHLQNLKELLLHGNRISGLQFCQRYLPMSLESLSLADNRIADLNEVCHVSHLPVLREFTIAGNPCVAAAAAVASHPHTPGQCVGFDYRPFVINWCMNLRVLDGYLVDAKESLRAEWLYSQGKGRSFRVGEQEALIVYLSSVCPPLPSSSGGGMSTYGPKGGRPTSAPAGAHLGPQSMPEGSSAPPSDNGHPASSQPPSTLSEEDRKLLLILSKAQLHQRELREQQQKADKGGSMASSAPSNYGMSSSYSSVLSSTMECPEKAPFEEGDERLKSEMVGSNGRADSGVKSRPSTASSSFASPFVRRRVKELASRGSPKRCSSRTNSTRQDHHHLRRFSSAGGEMVSSSSYNVELPVTLYGDEGSSSIMAQSMDEEQVAWGGRHKENRTDKENLMTRSLDPSLLSCSDGNDLDNGEAQERGSVVSVDVFAICEPPNYKHPTDIRPAWTGSMTATSRSLSGEDLSSNHRPKKLFSQTRVGEDAGMTVETLERKEDCNLEELTEDGNENPLQTATKLVPVPESIVSPEYRPQTSYMPTASVPPPSRQGHMPNAGGDAERRRGWGGGVAMTSRPGPTAASAAGHCCTHTPNFYAGAPSYPTHQPSNAAGMSNTQPTVSSSSPGTRRANQSHHHPTMVPPQHHHHHHHHHHPPTAPPPPPSAEAARCGRHIVGASAGVPSSMGGTSVAPSATASRGPPPVSSYYPTSTPSASGSPSTTRHACHVSSFHYNHAQQGRSGGARRGTSARSSSVDVHAPHSPAMSRVSRSSSRGAKIKKPSECVARKVGEGVERRMGLEAIKCVAVERRHQKEDGVGAEGDGEGREEEAEDDGGEKVRRAREAQLRAVLKIQSLWRGYRCRSEMKTGKNGDAFDPRSLKEDIRAMRMEDHIRLLSKELEATRGELGKERKLRLQQMEAIKSLWKEVFSMQNKSTPNCLQSPVDGANSMASLPLDAVPSGATPTALVDANVVAELSRTCATLQGQVQHLQDSLVKWVQCVSGGVHPGAKASREVERAENTNAAIQTYISAVMTPQGVPSGAFPPFPFGYEDDGSDRKGGAEEDGTTGGEGVVGDGGSGGQQANGESRPSYLPIFGGQSPSSKKPPKKGEEEEGGGTSAEGDVGDEDVSKEMQHYVEGLVDGVLKSIVPEDEKGEVE
ncbi:uncharacterized protein Cep97 [Hetaerina americana]|uniref:uncharacterized protein Cep97 n=1 Tax=Hetaerina americana TaxID=62018 RepID=UPI003A7F2DB9